MKRILFAIALFSIFAVGSRTDEPKNPPDYSGIYRLVGSEDGQPYSGAAVLTKRTDDTYMVDIVSAGSHTQGVGLIQDKIMSVGWVSNGVLGVSRYDIDGKTFRGVWVTRSTKTTRSERLEYLRNLDTDKEL